MSRDFTFKKRLIVGGVSLLLLADIALGGYRWHLANRPNTPAQQLVDERRILLKQDADIKLAEKTAGNFPKTLKDCDKFEQDLPSSSSVSSTISAELGDISKKA